MRKILDEGMVEEFQPVTERYDISEAFKALEGLDEDEDLDERRSRFNLSDEDDISAVKDYMIDDLDDDEDPIQMIIDIDAEDETELKKSYEGDIILQCNVCKDMIYKNVNNVVADEEDPEVYNKDEECPHCHKHGEGYTRIGVVAPFDAEESEELKKAAAEDEEAGSDELPADEDEPLDTGAEFEDKAEEKEKEPKEDKELGESLTESAKVGDKIKIINMSGEPRYAGKEGVVKSIDDMGQIHGTWGGCALVPGEDEYEVIESGSLKEAVEEIEIKTDDGQKAEIKVDDEGKLDVEVKDDKAEEADDAAVVTDEPVAIEGEAEVVIDKPEDEIDLDLIDESLFDNLVNNYVKEVYENVESYKTTSGEVNDNQIILEGIITYKSGKEKDTKFVFESDCMTKRGKVRFVGLNEMFSPAKKAFVLQGVLKENALLPESLTYNYNAKSLNESKRIYGRAENKLTEACEACKEEDKKEPEMEACDKEACKEACEGKECKEDCCKEGCDKEPVKEDMDDVDEAMKGIKDAIVAEVNKKFPEAITADDVIFDDSRAWSLYVRGSKLGLTCNKFGAYRDYEGGGVRGPIENNGREEDDTVELGKLFEDKLLEIEKLMNKGFEDEPEWDQPTGVLEPKEEAEEDKPADDHTEDDVVDIEVEDDADKEDIDESCKVCEKCGKNPCECEKEDKEDLKEEDKEVKAVSIEDNLLGEDLEAEDLAALEESVKGITIDTDAGDVAVDVDHPESITVTGEGNDVVIEVKQHEGDDEPFIDDIDGELEAEFGAPAGEQPIEMIAPVDAAPASEDEPIVDDAAVEAEIEDEFGAPAEGGEEVVTMEEPAAEEKPEEEEENK